MCGFLTEFCFSDYSVSNYENFEQLLKISKHRGPDHTEIFQQNNFRLGFNRLSVLDLSINGNQPRKSPSERYVVVFNGEIYNFKELAKSYSLYNLRSTSDTEVLLQLLDKIGVNDTLKQLNGMFAISIVDCNDNICYLARDFAGIKPLFYGVSKLGIVAASQFNQVFKHGWFKNDLRLIPEMMKSFFGFGYMQSPDTIFKDIFQVEPGQLITVSTNGKIAKSYFQRLDGTVLVKSNQDYTDVLSKSVKDQLVSDVPLGSFLSGGVDSPLITAKAQEEHKNLSAYTFKAENTDMDESETASAYAKHLGIQHQISQISLQNVEDIVNQHFKQMSEPFGDYSSIPTYLVTKEARKTKTVMLSGDGGDELFFGYPRFLHVIQHRHWFKVPIFIRRPLVRLCIKLGLLKTWGPYQYKSIGEWVMSKHTHIEDSVINKLVPNTEFPISIKKLYDFRKSDKSNVLKWLRLNEFHGHLQRILIKVDRMSMANSLEVRVPFLCKNAILRALDLFPNKFNHQSDLKLKLKSILADHVPQKLISDTKKGFTVPLDKWLKGPLSNDVKNHILDSPFYGIENVDKSVIDKYVLDYYENKHGSDWGIWHLYAWQKWAKIEELI